MQNDIVKRPPTEIVDRSPTAESAKVSAENVENEIVQQPVANVDVIPPKPQAEDKEQKVEEKSDNKTDELKGDAETPEKNKSVAQVQEPVSPKKPSNIPVLPISIAVVVCVVLVALLVLSQLKVIN